MVVLAVMPLDKKDINTYMDGVPVKISENYKRRPTIRIPNSCQNCSPGPELFEEYDFKMERNAIFQLEKLKNVLDERAQKMHERLQNFKKMEEKTVDRLKEMSLEPSQEDKCEANASSPNCLQSNILTPTNAVTLVKPIPMVNPSSFNFSDFEAINSSPFDNMELKTINDMEVLASVLSSSSEPHTSSGGKPASLPPNNNSFIPNKNGISWNKWGGHNMYSSPQYYETPSQFANMYNTSAYNVESSPSHTTWLSRDNIPTYQGTSMPGAHSTTANMLRYNSVDVGAHERNEDFKLSSQKSSSKSVPDLVIELENELKEKRRWEEQRRKTQTPPPRPTLSSCSGLEDWKPWPDLESPRHTGPDSLDSLDPIHHSLAQGIREMGFPIERIVRTIKKFHGDDKKVIEFLIQVQRLEEKMYNGDLVERALHINNYDECETTKHIDATLVLLDLGFDRDTIQRVLLECKNDRDAALERLIS